MARSRLHPSSHRGYSLRPPSLEVEMDKKNRLFVVVAIVCVTALSSLTLHDQDWFQAMMRASNPGEMALRLGLYLSGD